MNISETDWTDVWIEKMKSHINQENLLGCPEMWYSYDSALRFWNMAHENGGERINNTLKGLPLEPSYSVLDIGAGPGALAIPVASKVNRLTAVEPASGMCDVFREKILESGTDNIELVQKRWEDLDVMTDLRGPYDLVFASFSLEVPDIKKAIEKMNMASSRWVYLYWFAGKNSWEEASKDLWPVLHGIEYCPVPKCDVIYNILYGMEIYPNIATYEFRHINRFSSLDEAVINFSPQYGVKTPEQKEILKNYLAERVTDCGDTITLTGSSTRVKMWWEVGK